MKRVITYGTFDLFHKGHYNIIKRAKALGDYLIVGVTSESFDIERGKLNVRDSLIKRIENVRRTGLADEIIIEEYQGQKVSDIIKYDIDVLVVGSDWRGKFDYLKNYCDVVYLERTKNRGLSARQCKVFAVVFLSPDSELFIDRGLGRMKDGLFEQLQSRHKRIDLRDSHQRRSLMMIMLGSLMPFL